MKPYYEQDGITIYHGDCRDVLPTLEAVDAVITDPPYGIEWNGMGRSKACSLSSIANDNPDFDVKGIIGLTLKALRDKRHCYVFGKFDLTGLPIGSVAELIWDKIIPGPPGPGCWQYQHEYIQFFVKQAIPSARISGRGNMAARIRRGSILRYKRVNGAGIKLHPTEKPVALLQELVESSSRHGEVVLDPFMGSGSTLVAALIEGRRAIGIEIEEKYCEIAVKRLAQAVLPLEVSA